MIVTYKLLSGLYEEHVTLQLDMATIGQHHMRGNSRKLTVMRCRFDSLSLAGHHRRLRRRKPRVEFALLYIDWTWEDHNNLSVTMIPRYLASGTEDKT